MPEELKREEKIKNIAARTVLNEAAARSYVWILEKSGVQIENIKPGTMEFMQRACWDAVMAIGKEVSTSNTGEKDK